MAPKTRRLSEFMAEVIIRSIGTSATALTTGIPVGQHKYGIATSPKNIQRRALVKVAVLRRKRSAKMLLCLTIVVGWVSIAVPLPAQNAGYPIITSFNSADIGTDAMGWVTVQGTDGVLHFGCNGLVSFDGERWKTSPMNNAYALRGLDFDRSGRLWAAAVGEIGWFDKSPGAESWTYHSLNSHLPREHAVLGEVWQAFAEKEGAVFVSEDKIYRWNGSDFQVWKMPGPPARRLHAMRVGEKIYVHHRSTGLYELGPRGPRLIVPTAVLGDGLIFWMEPLGDGWILATGNGLFTFQNGFMRPFAPVASEYVVQQRLTCTLRLPNGEIALGTLNGGIVFVRPDGALDRIITRSDGLPTAEIFSLFVDRDNKLWATSSSAIFNLPSVSASTIFDSRAALSDEPLTHILREGGHIIAASDHDAWALQPEANRFHKIEGLPGQMRDLEQMPEGLIVAGFYGVKSAFGKQVSTLYSSAQDTFVAKPSSSWPGSILISVGRSIMLRAANGETRVLVENLPDIATSIAEDNFGRLWLGTTSCGILVARPTASSPVEATHGDAVHGLPAFDGLGLVVASPQGVLLAFSPRGGWLLSRDSISFTTIAGLHQGEVMATSEISSNGVLWAAYRQNESRPTCLGRIAINGNQAIWQPHSVEGLWNIGSPHSILAETTDTGDTVLWIGGTQGLLRHVVAGGPLAPRPRAPLLHAFAQRATADTLTPIAGPLPYATRAVLFEFAAPEFAMRPALRMETRIDGIDDRWVPADSSSRRELTAIRDGRYTFRVRTVAETGAISDETSFNFEILAPWWRTTPAIAGLLLALVPAGYGGYRLRVRALQRRNAELERKVSQRTEQLEQASAAKTQFVATMSHDIRNPLNGIVGLALALENTRLDPRQREIVATLRECTTYLSTLVDDVLDFASIEAGRVELRPGPFTPGELLRSVVTMLKADAAVSGASLTVETDPELDTPLLGDAGRIQQILVNYVSNALKYAGGHVRLIATIPAHSPGEVEFAVVDEGAGISGPEQATLFTKFTRLARAQRSEVTGTGLGLASCRLLADLMGGSVGVESDPGHGARFYLRLPIVAAQVPVEAPKLSLANTSVLLVEDADYNAWAATAVLAKLGLSCERAHTGQEALRLFGEKRFNLVLLDRNLPDMDGTEVARRIRSLEEDGPRSILLAVTAYCTPQDRALCLESGMDAFVGKPLTPDKLRKILIAAGRRLLTAATMHVSRDAPKPAVDISLLDYMSDGTEQGLVKQVASFLDALTEGETRLTHAATAHDFARLGDAAHYLLSHAKLIGSASLEEAALSLERAARSGDGFAFGELLQRVQREVGAVTEAMRRHRSSAQPA